MTTCSHCRRPHWGEDHICLDCHLRIQAIAALRRDIRRGEFASYEALGIILLVVVAMVVTGAILVDHRIATHDVVVTDLGGAP